MSLTTRVLLPVIVLAAGCAKAQQGSANDAAPGSTDAATSTPDVSCGDACDQDGDGVHDQNDQCPNTPSGAPVNKVGCADSQLMATLNPTFPPYGLTWTPTGDLGRAGGMTWTYTGIERGDLFHIYWIVCDDPATPCGLSLDGTIDLPAEDWQLSIPDTDLPNGKLVFTNTTQIVMADASHVPLNGRLTITIVDTGSAPIPFANVVTFPVTTRTGTYGAEIKGTGYTVHALAEVADSSAVWTPYLDYYDAAATPDDAGTPVNTSFDGWFYDK